MSNDCGCGPMSLILSAVLPMTDLLKIFARIQHHWTTSKQGQPVEAPSYRAKESRQNIDLHQRQIQQSRGPTNKKQSMFLSFRVSKSSQRVTLNQITNYPPEDLSAALEPSRVRRAVNAGFRIID